MDKVKRVLIADDEPEYLGWMVDFLEAQGLEVISVRTVSEGFAALVRTKFALLIVDMNIPYGGEVDPGIRARIPLVERYPGIALASTARNQGYGAHAVIAYTVHDDDAATAELGKLNCRYVLKGRPNILKSVVRSSLDPRS